MANQIYQGLYTIPRGHDFLCELARGVLAMTDLAQPELLARMTIWLPNNRAVRTLRTEFLNQAQGRALLLPRMMTVGELNDEQLMLGGWGMSSQIADLPPVINGLKRQWLLSDFICKRDSHLSRAQALLQACSLASLLDQLQAYEKTEEDLKSVVTGELASHWETTLQFLSIINHYWPQYLAENGESDPVMRRAALLHAQADAWHVNPVADPVIIAGDISAQVGKLDPATRALLKSVLQLPQGMVVLPAFDCDMSPEEWNALDSVHPDYLIKELLDQLAATRGGVKTWPDVKPVMPERQAWLREAMRPADNTTAWRALHKRPLTISAIDGMQLVNCTTEQEEAQAIALIVRQALEVDGQTVSLVTPDRALGRLVSGQLRRWDIWVDDSSGVPLMRTPLGVFLLLVIAACQPRATVFDGLALGKHIRLQMGMESGQAHRQFRDLERLVLRETFIGPTLAAWKRALTDDRIYIDPADRNRLIDFYSQWLTILRPLHDILLNPERDVRLTDIIDAHLTVAEALGASDSQSGAESLWQGAEGNCAAMCFFKIREALGDRIVKAGDYADLLKVWFQPENVRVAYESHPRVTIHGLIEARQQQADVVILGSLNEGVWPELPPPNPFLSHRMMHDLDLPDPETKIGQAAHDFLNGITAKQVYLTRAERVKNAPTVPARWLLRMNAVLTDPEVAKAWQQSGEYWTQLAQQLDRPAGAIVPMAAPAPTPPRAARPNKLSVTQVEQWLRDPYGLYARKILNLRRLPNLQTLPSDAQRGQLVHAALEAFTRDTLDRAQLYPADFSKLLFYAQAELQRYIDQPDIYALWQSYLDIVANWFFEREEEGRETAVPVATEIQGSVNFIFGDTPFTLIARADRIDRAEDGSLHILDYKTGSAPSGKKMLRGAAAQLALEAVIAEGGGFTGLGNKVSNLSYWQLPGRAEKGDIKSPKKGDLETIIAAAREALERLVLAFDNDTTPYLPTPLPDRMPPHNDYAHLERTLEWAFAENGDETAEATYG